MNKLSLSLNLILLMAGGINAYQDTQSNDSLDTASLRGSDVVPSKQEELNADLPNEKPKAKNLYTSLYGSKGHLLFDDGTTTSDPYSIDQSLFPLPISREKAIEMTDQSYGVGIVKHIVLIKFVDNITPENAAVVTERFLSLKDICYRYDGGDDNSPRKYVISVEAGTHNSYEGTDMGFDFGFIVTFGSVGDRNYYVGTPLINEDDIDLYEPHHNAFKKFIDEGTSVKEDIAFDFYVGNQR